jgi:hypothetical protein
MTFNEHDHSRSGDGRFATTAHAEASCVTLPADRPMRAHELFRAAAEEAAAGAPIREIEPATKAEAKRLLDNQVGLPDGAVLQVELVHETTPERGPSGYTEIAGPADGRPLIVHTGSTNREFRLASGKAVIRADSSAGNSLTIGPGAEAILIASPDAHVTVHVEDGGHAIFQCEKEPYRFLAFTEGSGRVDVQYGGAEPRPYARRAAG